MWRLQRSSRGTLSKNIVFHSTIVDKAIYIITVNAFRNKSNYYVKYVKDSESEENDMNLAPRANIVALIKLFQIVLPVIMYN